MSDTSTPPLRKMTAQELESDISQTYDVLSQHKAKLFQFFYFYNNKFGYIPQEEVSDIGSQMENALRFALLTSSVAIGTALALDILFLKKKTVHISRLWKVAWRVPYYGLITIYGYGIGYERRTRPILKNMEASCDRNQLDYNKYRNVLKTLYKEKMGEPLPDFDMDGVKSN